MYYWLLYQPIPEYQARLTFRDCFGHEPECCDWDAVEGCWWLGHVSKDEKKRYERGPAQLQLVLPLDARAETTT